MQASLGPYGKAQWFHQASILSLMGISQYKLIGEGWLYLHTYNLKLIWQTGYKFQPAVQGKGNQSERRLSLILNQSLPCSHSNTMWWFIWCSGQTPVKCGCESTFKMWLTFKSRLWVKQITLQNGDRWEWREHPSNQLKTLRRKHEDSQLSNSAQNYDREMLPKFPACRFQIQDCSTNSLKKFQPDGLLYKLHTC